MLIWHRLKTRKGYLILQAPKQFISSFVIINSLKKPDLFVVFLGSENDTYRRPIKLNSIFHALPQFKQLVIKKRFLRQ